MAELVPVPDAKLALGTTTSLNFDMPQTSISFVYPAIPRKDPEFFAAYLMNHILGGGFTSRLYAEVREKRGLAYSVSSSMVMRDHVSALMISTATRPDKAQESLKIIREQVAAMAADGPTEDELAAAKTSSRDLTPSTIWIHPPLLLKLSLACRKQNFRVIISTSARS